MIVYGIGGLGVDERVFAGLSLKFDLTPLRWIPAEPKESLEHYAARFAEQVDTSTSFSIIGVSFGGMLAIELNKILNPEKIILISSASSKFDIPVLYRLFGHSGILKILPNGLLKPPPLIANWVFGVREKRYKQILKQVIADTDSHFMKWAINEIICWNNVDIPPNVIRIHGTGDRLLKCSGNGEVIFKISNTVHFMIMDSSPKVSRLLNQTIVQS